MSANPKRHIAREKGSFVSHVATLATGTAISQAVTFAAMLVLTRLFAPEAFGLLAVFMTIVSLFSVLGGARYELAIMLPDDDHEAANVLHPATLVLAAICVLSLFAVTFLHGWLAPSWPSPWWNHGCGQFRRYFFLAVSTKFLVIGAGE